MRRTLIALLSLALMVMLGAAKCEDTGQQSHPGDFPPPIGQPAKPDPKNDTNPNGQAEPKVQDDPGACVKGAALAPPPVRDITMSAHWSSETRAVPTVAWSLNGAVTTATGLTSGPLRNGLKGYEGEWSKTLSVKCHDVVSIEIKGTSSMFSALCTINDLGDGPLKTGQRNCKAEYTVP